MNELDPLRYPIGQFRPNEQPTPEQRSGWIDDLSKMPQLIRGTVENLTWEQLQTPYRPGGWTVQQVIHHMADNDMNAYFRFKRGLTEDNPTAGTYREDMWAEMSDYRNVPIEVSLVLLESIYIRFEAIIRSLSASDFARTFVSPTHGMMTLDVALQRFIWHDRHHLAQIASLKEQMGWQE